MALCPGNLPPGRRFGADIKMDKKGVGSEGTAKDPVYRNLTVLSPKRWLLW
jgi:hypothetical protein